MNDLQGDYSPGVSVYEFQALFLRGTVNNLPDGTTSMMNHS